MREHLRVLQIRRRERNRGEAGIGETGEFKIGDRIRELREERGLSQGDVEQRTGLLRCYLSRVECGHGSNPGVDVLVRLADAFEISLGDFFPRNFVSKDDAAFLKEVGTYTLTSAEQKRLVLMLRNWTR